MITVKRALDQRRNALITATFTSVAAFEPILEPVPPALTKLLDDVSANASAVCLQVKGNQHTVYGLLRQPPDFDVVTRQEPDLDLLPGAQIIPEGAFTSFFERSLCGLEAMLKYLSRYESLPRVVLGPPPPIGDAAFLIARLDDYFLKRLEAMGAPKSEAMITPSLVRWKVWSILNRVYESMAVKHGATWLPTPQEALDQGRYLHPNAWGSDATHANAWFGELRLNQIEAVLS